MYDIGCYPGDKRCSEDKEHKLGLIAHIKEIAGSQKPVFFCSCGQKMVYEGCHGKKEYEVECGKAHTKTLQKTKIFYYTIFVFCCKPVNRCKGH